MGYVFVFIILGVLALLSAFSIITTIYAGIIAAPFVATPKKIIIQALKIVSLKPGEKFYDLGAGNGTVLVIAEKQFGAHSTGFELSLHHYFFSLLNIWLHNCKNTHIFWKNFYFENLSDADVIFCWLTPKAFPKLKDKFNNELRIGTRIIAYSSPLLFWEPDEIIQIPKKGKLFFYTKQYNTN